MPNFRRTVCSRCKALAVVNHVTAVQIHLNSKAFIIKLLHDFSAFILSKKNYPAECLQQRTQPIRRECSVTVSAECIQFLCHLHGFSKKQSHLAAPGSALMALLPDSVALRKAHWCSALAVMIQSSAAPSSDLLFLRAYHLQAHPPGKHSCGSRHVTSYFLQHSPHLLIKLLSLLALPKEIFCKSQMFIVGSNVCRSPYAQVFFSQTRLC